MFSNLPKHYEVMHYRHKILRINKFEPWHFYFGQSQQEFIQAKNKNTSQFSVLSPSILSLPLLFHQRVSSICKSYGHLYIKTKLIFLRFT